MIRLTILVISFFSFFVAGCSSSRYSTMLPIPHMHRQLIGVASFLNETNDKRFDPLMDDLTGSFVHELSTTKSFRIIERHQLVKLLEEQTLSASGVVDESSIRRVGKLLGMEAMMLGSLSSVTSTQDRTGIGTFQYIKENIEIEMNARLVDVETGEILATARVVTPFERSRATLGSDFETGDKSRLENVVERAMFNMAQKLAYEISYNYREYVVPQYIDD